MSVDVRWVVVVGNPAITRIMRTYDKASRKQRLGSTGSCSCLHS
jgi:hypothetical protein